MPVDEEGRAVAPCLMWADARGAKQLTGLLAGRRPDALLRLLLWERLAGGAPDLGGDPLGHEHLLRAQSPEVCSSDQRRSSSRSTTSVSARLTGRWAATPAFEMIASFLVRSCDRSGCAALLVSPATSGAQRRIPAATAAFPLATSWGRYPHGRLRGAWLGRRHCGRDVVDPRSAQRIPRFGRAIGREAHLVVG